MEIPEININKLDVPDIRTWVAEPSVSIPMAPPVVVNIGIPIVDIPGCVEAHEANNNSKTLQNDDERGLVTYCDGNVPSYNPPDFEPNQMLPTQRPKVDTRQPKSPEAPDLPIPKTPAATAKVDCPTPAQAAKEPVGTYIEGFRKKVTDYQLIGDQCIQITEPVPIPEQIIAGLPAPGMVMTTGGIAIIATTSALMAKPLADILLKVIKPTVKKVMKKIAAIRGKEVRIESLSERRDQQRIRSHAIRKLKGKE
jgi:hypothetical protein